ncbi:MAG: mannose-1-phosphate guanylyltransferase [Phycisphaeraceae bacterium]
MRYAVIMAGGSGTRLWPMSRDDQPKQLIPFIQGRSLLQIAADRLEGLIEPERQIISTGEKYRAAIRKAMPRFIDEQILGEPTGRDTLAAVGFPAAVLARRGDNPTIAVFTADHIIEPIDRFQQQVRLGLDLAERDENTLVTFGIEPTHPATGYGYVELGQPIPSYEGAHTTAAFKEKPDPATAKQYVKSGRYLWNSGMFVWKAQTLLNLIARYEPEVHAGLMEIAKAWDTPERLDVLNRVYPTLKKISVDYALMERAAADDTVSVTTVSMPVEWLDVGSWEAFGKTLARDDADNALAADRAIAIDANRNLVVSDDTDHLVALLGVDDLVVIRTARATLVCHRDHAEKIKQLHARIADQFGPEYL